VADAPTYQVLHRAIVAEGARIRAIPGLLDRARAFLKRMDVADLRLPEDPAATILPDAVLRGPYVRWLFHGFVAAEGIDIDFTDWILASARAGAWIECRPGNELRQPIDEKGNRLRVARRTTSRPSCRFGSGRRGTCCAGSGSSSTWVIGPTSSRSSGG